MASRPLWLGPCLVVVAAISFAAGTTTAVVAYEAGAAPLSVITTRVTFTMLVVFVLIRATGGKFSLPTRDRAVALVVGLVLAVQSFCHYEAIALLPVAIAILVMYLYPLLVGLISHFLGRERMRPVLGVALAIALVGLFFALEAPGDGLNPFGIVLAVGAAATFAIVIVANASIIQRTGRSLLVTFHMNLSASATFIVLCAVFGEFPLPASREGWIAYSAVPVFYSIGLICFFFAVGVIGAVKSSLIMNFEPVAAIILGFIMLGQVLTWLQLFGAALVVGAIFVGRSNEAERT